MVNSREANIAFVRNEYLWLKLTGQNQRFRVQTGSPSNFYLIFEVVESFSVIYSI